MFFHEEEVPESPPKFEPLSPTGLTFENRACDLCGHADTPCLIRSIRFFGHDFRFVRCANCGLLYQNPRIEDKSLQQIYESADYWNGDANRETMYNYFNYAAQTDWRSKNGLYRVRRMESLLSPGSTVVDIGCSDGLFVRQLVDAGFFARGLDISSAMLEYGRDRYLVDLRQCSLEKVWPFEQGMFDAITCFATVSNFSFPSKVFENIRRHLKPGGFLFFNYLDIDRLACRMGLDGYVYRPTVGTIFSTRTLASYLENHGMELQRRWPDIQFLPTSRVLGMFGKTRIANLLRLVGLGDLLIKVPLLTGYLAAARRHT